MNRARQSGLALLTVMLVMALLTLLIAGTLRSHQLLVGSLSRQIESSHLLQLAYAAERQALRQLRQQREEMAQSAHGGQRWAQVQHFDSERGQARWQLRDLAGRFNLGALLASETPDALLLERWERLCRSLQVQPPELQSLVGRPMIDVLQLRALPGVSREDMAALAPRVTLLPRQAGLNVNTASATLLAALGDISPAVAQRVADKRPAQGYTSVQAFLAQPELEGLGLPSRGLTTTSRWFQLEVEARSHDAQLYLYSDIELDPVTQDARVTRRVFSAARIWTSHE